MCRNHGVTETSLIYGLGMITVQGLRFGVSDLQP